MQQLNFADIQGIFKCQDTSTLLLLTATEKGECYVCYS